MHEIRQLKNWQKFGSSLYTNTTQMIDIVNLDCKNSNIIRQYQKQNPDLVVLVPPPLIAFFAHSIKGHRAHEGARLG